MLRKDYADRLKANVSTLFLLLLLAWLLLEPLTLRWAALNVVFLYVFSFLMLGGLYVVTAHRRLLITCIVLTALGLLLEGLTVFVGAESWQGWSSLLGGATDVLITFSILWHTAFKRMYTRDDVFAGIIGFLLISGCFADIYMILHNFQPGSIHFQKVLGTADVPIAHPGSMQEFLLTMNDFLYFSFMTITTVGYGDVVPVSHFARRLTSIEACAGVLYIAMFVGRLMGLYMWGLHRQKG